ncbi:hypothetical protein [Paraburkholderia sp. J94]|uniref:hypothetical protein n=1 Tax=Paraburkholderia sp. J94 TaxID=2805441 RepID=UPI002AAF57EE|nr:hypothetical protein [Paraburkholderia sp. J94]
MNGRASYCQGIAWVIAPVLLPDCFRIARIAPDGARALGPAFGDPWRDYAGAPSGEEGDGIGFRTKRFFGVRF